MTESPVIVCGTDFTEVAREVADLAASLAGALGGRLHLSHVIDRDLGIWLEAEARERVRALAVAALDGEVARLQASHAVPVAGRVETGPPGAELAKVAAAEHARLLVVGAAGPTPSIFRLGGTAERAAQAAHVPVLLVRNPAPLRAWLRGDPLAVAALISDDRASDHAIEWLRLLRTIGACDIAVLRGYYVDEAARWYGLSPRPLVIADPQIESYIARDLEARVDGLGGRGALAVHPVLALGRIADHLVEHPAARDAGLVVVGNHRARGLARLSSVAAGVVHLATSSVLVVPADAPAVAKPAWPQIRRVVVATDFSDFAAAAIRHAYGLLAAGGGEVTLVHVMDEPAGELGRTEATARLQALVPEWPPRGVTTAIDAVWHRDAATAIVEQAARASADAIVVASHGRTGLRRVLLGSVAAGVVERSRVPVLIVRPPPDAGS